MHPKSVENEEEVITEEREDLFASGAIVVRGARVHNLKNISVAIPRHKFTVVTGLSGSGKSSLVFDVLLAEGQRRYIETFSAYARGFLSSNKRPEVDQIEGLSPVVAIEQKTASHNPRSTVGTVTEVYDFLRLLYARVATPYSYITGNPMVRYNRSQLCDLIQSEYQGQGIEVLAPVVRDRKGHYRELFETLRMKGFLYALVDGEIKPITKGMMVSRYKRHYIAVVVDKFTVRQEYAKRIDDAVALALAQGDGLMDIRLRESGQVRHLSSRLMDPEGGIAYPEPSAATFSFNAQRGWCPHCKGLGTVEALDEKKVVLDGSKSVVDGAIPILSKLEWKSNKKDIAAFLEERGIAKTTPAEQLPREVLEVILYGDSELPYSDPLYRGVWGRMNDLASAYDFDSEKKELFADFLHTIPCPECQGFRLSKEALSYRIGDYTIGQLTSMELAELRDTIPLLRKSLSPNAQVVAEEILKEISVRLSFMLDVGLEYLSLGRSAVSLSGGESQRIRLATQIGTGLVEVLYLLDEPGIGLHARDNERLVNSIKKLRDGGNSVVVVEHDRSTMLAADYLIDLGPGAGRLGGEVVFEGSPQAIKSAHTTTADYLNGV